MRGEGGSSPGAWRGARILWIWGRPAIDIVPTALAREGAFGKLPGCWVRDEMRTATHVYNHLDTVDIDKLLRTCTTGEADILLGDFNRRHKLWGGSRVICATGRAKQLAEGVTAAGMECLTSTGVVTYSQSDNTANGRYCSTIDLTFASCGISSRVGECVVLKDVPGFDSDHRIVKTTFDISPNREITTRFLWKRANKKGVQRAVARALEPLGLPALKTTAETDRYAEDRVKKIRSVVNRNVPTRPSQALRIRPRPDGELREMVENEIRNRPNNQQWPPGFTLSCKSTSERIESIVRTASFRRHVARKATGSRGAHAWG